MTEGIEAITRTVLSLALDAANLRQQVIATNIANANVLDYVPQTVSFDSQLDEARRSLSEAGRLDPATLVEVHPYLETNALTSRIEIDMQVADMARNALQYQALLRGLSRHYEILSLAVNGQK